MKVLAHIVGASGAGKSTLVSYINTHFDNLIAKDLDEFDDKAVKELGYTEKKSLYTDAMLKKLNKKKQELLDSWILKQKCPVVLAGHYTEGDNKLEIHAHRKFLLDTPPEVAAYRQFKRSQSSNPDEKGKIEDFPLEVAEARKDIAEFRKDGYEKVSKHHIIKYLRGIYGYGKI